MALFTSTSSRSSHPSIWGSSYWAYLFSLAGSGWLASNPTLVVMPMLGVTKSRSRVPFLTWNPSPGMGTLSTTLTLEGATGTVGHQFGEAQDRSRTLIRYRHRRKEHCLVRIRRCRSLCRLSFLGRLCPKASLPDGAPTTCVRRHTPRPRRRLIPSRPLERDFRSGCRL
jgi:hypothetical protein